MRFWIIIDESRNEVLSNHFLGESQTLQISNKELPMISDLTPEDVLYKLCKQKEIDYEDFSCVFEWFSKDDKIYVISQKLNVDLNC